MDRRASLSTLLASLIFCHSAWAGQPPRTAADARTALGPSVTSSDPIAPPPAGTSTVSTGGTLGGGVSISMLPGLFIVDPLAVITYTSAASTATEGTDWKDTPAAAPDFK